MTGPEHYREAERLAASLKNRDMPAEAVVAGAAVAQVHATLALAAACAPQTSAISQTWKEVLS